MHLLKMKDIYWKYVHISLRLSIYILVLICYPSGTHLVRIMRTVYAFGTHLVLISCALGAHLVRMWSGWSWLQNQVKSCWPLQVQKIECNRVLFIASTWWTRIQVRRTLSLCTGQTMYMTSTNVDIPFPICIYTINICMYYNLFVCTRWWHVDTFYTFYIWYMNTHIHSMCWNTPGIYKFTLVHTSIIGSQKCV